MSSDSETELEESKIYCEHSDMEASDSSSQLIIESPKKRKIRQITVDRSVIEDIEEDMETNLDMKAAKTNLTNVNVKNILRHVVANEEVLAMVHQAANPDTTNDKQKLTYEPKITRAKAKELNGQGKAVKPWIIEATNTSPSPDPEIQVLIHEELPEDSSDDEYVPIDVESEEDKDSSFLSESETRSTGPAMPLSADCSTQTTWTEDGVFKIPPIVADKNNTLPNESGDNNITIAARTRSRLCLNDTPLEAIEEAFIPPDITTDMYDMECDDEDWSNFLKEFNKPLDEVVKSQEDEEQDPEYNILADEENNEDLKEELRADRGVKITKKELNDLIAELVEYADNFNQFFPSSQNEDQAKNEENQILPDFYQNNLRVDYCEIKPEVKILMNYTVMEESQKDLLNQQLRQHVQMLTQNFLLSYEHPEFNSVSVSCKLLLDDLKNASENNFKSVTKISNLDCALEVIDQWIEMFKEPSALLNDYKNHTGKLIYEAKQAKSAGTAYVPNFHKLILDTISQCDAFLYPAILPRIPLTTNINRPISFTSSENELIAIGLEQFTPYLKLDPKYRKKNGSVSIKDVCFFIQSYMMPSKNATKLYNHVCNLRLAKDANPVKHYYEVGSVPVTVHYVVSLDQLKQLPPCKRNPNELPHQWKKHLFPECFPLSMPSPSTGSITKVNKPPAFNKFLVRNKSLSKCSKVRSSESFEAKSKFETQTNYKSFLTKKEIFASTPRCKKSLFKLKTPGVKQRELSIPVSLLKVKFNSSIFEKLHAQETMNSMPSLENNTQGSFMESSIENEEISSSIASSAAATVTDESSSRNESSDLKENSSMTVKDNLEDISALVVASSTIKTNSSSTSKKRPSVMEKKRAKILKDYAGNLTMLSAQNEETENEKQTRFILAFYDKVQETLEIEDYHKFMLALNDFDETKSDVMQLHRKIDEILSKKYSDLACEYVVFLDALQAKTMGKLVPYLMTRNISLFLRKLEIFFQDQPSQVRKIYRALTTLTSSNDYTMNQVKATILPLLKGNNLLTDWFLQIFPNEKPPESLLNGPWDTVSIGKDKDLFETVTIPEIEDPYGGPNCICGCHSASDDSFKARARHCTPCGTKFMQGRVYIQTGKGLRLATISFDDNSIDHKARLSQTLKPKKTEVSPTKLNMQSKENHEEIRLSSDEETEKKQRAGKSPRKRKIKKKVNESCLSKQDNENEEPANVSLECGALDKGDAAIADCVDLANEGTNDSSDPKVTGIEEQAEWDCNTSIESMELRLSPDHPSNESESEFGEEMELSQDSDASFGETEQSASTWTREEDKLILETFQQEEVMEEAFKKIATNLMQRSPDEIKQRFHVLISFLKKMTEST